MLHILINFLMAALIIDSILMILIILMQRPKSEGLGAAFGGGMTDNLFGAQTTNVLQTFTRYLGGAFFALALTLSVLYGRMEVAHSPIQQQLLNAPKPAVVIPPAPAKPMTPGAEKTALPAASTAPKSTPPAPMTKPVAPAPVAPAPAPVK